MATAQLAEGTVAVEGRELKLPHLAGRGLTMKRYPHGVDGPHFYEKQCPPWRPDWVSIAPVWTERKQQDIDFCVIGDVRMTDTIRLGASLLAQRACR